MHPRVPELLSRLVGIADAMQREHEAGKLVANHARSIELGQVYGELAEMRVVAVADGSFDDTATMLARCLMIMETRGGRLGSPTAEAKWAILAKSFLAFVRTDLAKAMERAAHPATTEQTRDGR